MKIKCTKCGSEVDTAWEKCPSCNEPIDVIVKNTPVVKGQKRIDIYGDRIAALKAHYGVSDQDVFDAMLKKAETLGFFRKHAIKSRVKDSAKAIKQNLGIRLADDYPTVYAEGKNESIPQNYLFAVRGWYIVNNSQSQGVLLLYADKLVCYYLNFKANFGLVGLAASGKNLSVKLEIPLQDFVKANPLESIENTRAIKTASYTFYTYSPLESAMVIMKAQELAKGEFGKKSEEIFSKDLIVDLFNRLKY